MNRLIRWHSGIVIVLISIFGLSGCDKALDIWQVYDKRCALLYAYQNVPGDASIVPLPIRHCFDYGICPAWSRASKKCGYVDMMGWFVIAPQFDNAEPFSEGRAVVRTQGADGIIDTAGRWIVRPQYPYICEQSEGMSVYGEGNDPLRYGYLDCEGKIAIKAMYIEAHRFSDGVALVSEVDYKHTYYIDHRGDIRIRLPEGAEDADDFHQGLAAIMYWDDSKEKMKYGFISTTGELVIPAKFTSVGYFQEGLAPVSMTDSSLFRVSMCFAAQEERSGEWGFIDREGVVVVPMIFQKLGVLSEGLARYWENGKWGYVNREGKTIIPPQFVVAGDFEGGMAEIVLNGFYAYIDRSGKVVIRTTRQAIEL